MRCPVPIGDRQFGHGALRRRETLGSLVFACRAKQGVCPNLVKPEASDVECQQPDQEDKDNSPAKRVWDQAQPEPALWRFAHPRATAGTNMYPAPRIVLMMVGLSSVGSIFRRSLLTITSTVRSSASETRLRARSSSWSRLRTR